MPTSKSVNLLIVLSSGLKRFKPSEPIIHHFAPCRNCARFAENRKRDEPRDP
jgi:hypothetical protein